MAKTASPEHVAVMDDPPDWFVTARDNQSSKRGQRWRRRERHRIAGRLGVQVRAVREHNVTADDVEELLARQPDWLMIERRRQDQIEREAKNTLGRELADTLITSVHEVWFQELNTATTDAEVDTIDARWAPEVGRAKQEARRGVDELTGEQVGARIDREDQALRAGARYRATQLVRRAFRDDDAR